MKCSNCGCENFFEPKMFISDASFDCDSMPKIYACVSCGHLEMFAPAEQVNRHKEILIKKAEFEKEIEKMTKELDELLKKDSRSALKEKIQSLKKNAESLDITLRQKQQILDEVEQLQKTLQKENLGIGHEIFQQKDRIKQLQARISLLK